jgi:hypothetical protein
MAWTPENRNGQAMPGQYKDTYNMQFQAQIRKLMKREKL